jgi:hypothetical protein
MVGDSRPFCLFKNISSSGRPERPPALMMGDAICFGVTRRDCEAFRTLETGAAGRDDGGAAVMK